MKENRDGGMSFSLAECGILNFLVLLFLVLLGGSESARARACGGNFGEMVVL